MKKTLLVLFFLLSYRIFGQVGEIHGKISHSHNGHIAFASIQIEKLGLGTFSNEKGEFSISNIPYGDYTLLVSSVEIVAKKVRVTIKQPHILVQIPVETQDISLNEVSVVHQTEKRALETKGFAVNVIETKELAQRNFQTNELLDRTVGIRVRQNGGLGSNVQYNLNGMSGNSVRIFIDGIPLSTYGESFSLNSIPPALIERIEVYKGVIPAHLADDALGGAINVILKKSTINSLTSSLSYGSFQTLQANLSGNYRDGRTGFTVKAAAFHNYSDNDYEVRGKFVRNILPNGRYEYVTARRFNDAYRSSGIQAQIGFTDVKWANQFFIGYNGSADYKEIQHGTYMSIPYMGRFTTSDAHVASLQYSKKNLGVKGLELTLNGIYSQRNQVVVDTVRWNYNWHGKISIGLNGEPILRPGGAQQGAPTIQHIDRNISTFRAGLTYELNQHNKLTTNHIYYKIDRSEQDFMRSEIEREFIGTRQLEKNITSFAYEAKAFDGKFQSNLFAKFYQQTIQKTDPVLRVINGESTRQEVKENSTKTNVGYGLATSYALHKRFILLGSTEKSVRLPSENEVFGNPGENIVENFGIRPEVSYNYNLGVNIGSFGGADHRISGVLSGFLRDTRDKIVQRINPRLNDALQTNPYENIGKNKAIGFEIDLHYTYLNNLRIDANMSKFNSVFNMQFDENGREYAYFNQQLPNEPFWTANTNVQYSWKNIFVKGSSLQVFYAMRFVERFYTTWLLIEDFRTPRQYIQDVGVSYRLPKSKWIISLDGKNIFNEQVFDNFAVQKPGRAIYLKINYLLHSL